MELPAALSGDHEACSPQVQHGAHNRRYFFLMLGFNTDR